MISFLLPLLLLLSSASPTEFTTASGIHHTCDLPNPLKEPLPEVHQNAYNAVKKLCDIIQPLQPGTGLAPARPLFPKKFQQKFPNRAFDPRAIIEDRLVWHVNVTKDLGVVFAWKASLFPNPNFSVDRLPADYKGFVFGRGEGNETVGPCGGLRPSLADSLYMECVKKGAQTGTVYYGGNNVTGADGIGNQWILEIAKVEKAGENKMY